MRLGPGAGSESAGDVPADRSGSAVTSGVARSGTRTDGTVDAAAVRKALAWSVSSILVEAVAVGWAATTSFPSRNGHKKTTTRTSASTSRSRAAESANHTRPGDLFSGSSRFGRSAGLVASGGGGNRSALAGVRHARGEAPLSSITEIPAGTPTGSGR